MSGRRFVLSGTANRDLVAIHRYIAADNPDAADRLLRRIFDRFAFLAENRHAGRSRDDVRPGLRSSPIGRYVVFYRLRGAEIEVVRVLHGMRNVADLL